MRALRIALLCAAIAACGSCRNVLGIDDREVTANKCGDLKVPATCADCLERRCCAEGLACASDSQCDSALRCEAGCSDSACRAECDAKLYTKARGALVACRAASCAAECGVKCGDVITGDGECRECVSRSCCTIVNACQSSPPCNEMRQCVQACANDSKCVGECANRNHEGASRWLSVVDCITTTCATPCARWQCPRITPPTTSASQIAIVVKVRDAETRSPIVGADVRGCAEISPDCMPPPFGETKTDAAGIAGLVVKPSTTSRNYTGFVEIVDADHKGLAFFQPPLAMNGADSEVVLPGARSIAAIALASDVPLFADRGLIVIPMIDCSDNPGAGVTITTDRGDADTKTFYFDGASPSIKVKMTDSSGVAGFMNAREGLHKITATVNATTVATTTVFVRRGYTTFTRMRGGFY
jgi:hypothetical protein